WVARALGIDRVEAEVGPEEKVEVIQRLRREGGGVSMAGGGVNDAPPPAGAHGRVAVGTRTHRGVGSPQGHPRPRGPPGILRARRLSRATMRNIRQNLFFAFVYNMLGVPIAAGVLYPSLGVLLSPIVAAAAMSFSSVSVIGNALRLRGARL